MSWYDFHDVTDKEPVILNSPAEDLKIDGKYFSAVVHGSDFESRILYTKGREALSAKEEATEVGKRDGAVYRYKRYPTREITVGYQLLADDPVAFRKAYNALAKFLHCGGKEVKIEFSDDEGRYFVGTPTDIDKVDAGGNNVTGEFTIYCTDPYKYDPTQTRATISGTGEGGGMIENSGMPVLPVLEAEATSDLGYVAFYCNGAEILVGDPAEQDYASRTENQELVSSVFSSGLDGWEKGTGILEDNADQSMSVSQDGTGVYLEA